MNDWQTTTVGDCLERISLKGITSIPTKDYQKSGNYPIIDQGKSEIAGWTDDPDSVVYAPLPLVVFGDHSRTLKFVECPFARGADGTQLLRPKHGIDPHFFYFACKAIDLPTRGYNRHFTLLKEKEFSYPIDVAEQSNIAQVLTQIERAVRKQDEVLEILQRTKESAMGELFSRGHRGEPQKETEIGSIPESWATHQIGDDFSVASGGTPSRTNPDYWDGGEIPWVKTGEVNYSVITSTSEHITKAGLDNSAAKLLPPGTLLMAMYGQGVTRGKVGILGIEAATNQACAAMIPTTKYVGTKFLYHYLSNQYEKIRTLAHGGQQQNLNLDIVKNLKVPVPKTVEEQDEIVEVLDCLDRKITLHARKREVLNQLFESLLHKLMVGEISVDDLDLSALGSSKEVGTHGSD